jgi:hypothetical protein
MIVSGSMMLGEQHGGWAMCGWLQSDHSQLQEK